MAHFHIKKKKGRPYLYVREIARIGGKPKVISQIYLGSPDRVAAMASGQEKEVHQLKVEEFGSLWLAHQIDRDIDLAGIVDSVIPRAQREEGPTVGEYFLYCVWNRMVEAVSKNQLSDWYKQTAIQHIRPVELEALTSQRYWEKWERVSEAALKEITLRFFKRLWQIESPNADCLLFDTTNYYTFMASNTESELAKRGKNKAGRHSLRQIGVGLLAARASRLPLYYCIYPGNLHDSRLFESVMDEMFGIVCGLNVTKERLSVIIDKGMNSEDNYAWIDEHSRIHFVTAYSPYFAEKLAHIPLNRFEPASLKKNEALIKEGHWEDCILCYRTKGEYWGKERAVVVTYNPAMARKKSYILDNKLSAMRQELLKMRLKVRKQAPQWRKAEAIRERYLDLCRSLHISPDLYRLKIRQTKSGLVMNFSQNVYQIKRKRLAFGRNIIITDNLDWTTSEIIEAHLDRWQIEQQFRLSNDDDLVGVQPIRHWTDSKIRCHLFTCIAAMTYLRRIELKLAARGVRRTAEEVMKDMRRFHSVLSVTEGARKPARRLETPTKTQSEALRAFGYQVDKSGVLQTIIR